MATKLKSIVATSLIVSSQFSQAHAESIQVKDLENFGLDSNEITLAFKREANIDLNPNETLKVSPENEGNSIRFESLDQFSVIVPVMHSRGIQNKDQG